MIHVERLTKSFEDLRRGTVTALDHVSFDVHPGEIFGLLGPNGAGKTTCLRILSTVLRPSHGLATIASLKDQGKCIIFSTHIMREVEKLCDRVAIIHKGRILADGSVAELQGRYRQTDMEELFFDLISQHELEPPVPAC